MVARLSSFLLLSAAATCLVANSEGSRPVSGLSTLKVSTSGRDTVAFDFGWRFRTGLHATAPVGEPPANTDPGVSPPESRPDYDASSWEAVALPHDGLIASTPLNSSTAGNGACPGGCSGNSFIPRHVLWYRKTFTIPSDWEGSSYWIDFQGSFRNTTVWLNGELVTNHVCGYTPFRVRLDNVTSVVPGKATTIAVSFFASFNNPIGSVF